MSSANPADQFSLCEVGGMRVLDIIHAQADRVVGGGPHFAAYQHLAAVIRSIFPLMQRFGVATAEEVEIETLADRLREEIVSGGGCLSLPLTVGVSARKL